MKTIANETIAAIATPQGQGGIGIVRISGPETIKIAESMVGKVPRARCATYTKFLANNGDVLDEGVTLYFKAPYSFTGEDVLELHGHGGPVVMDMLLRRVVECGARLARPGEFSERAFLNNKLDLSEAEAIADLINAHSEQAARSAIRSLQGEFSKQINELVQKLIHLRMFVETSLDFPEEEINFLSDKRVSCDLQQIIDQLNQVLQSANQGRLLQEGMTVVIAGKPNAGKSSLLNLLSGQESAIVTDIPGTTRDILREYVQLDGLPLHIIDTAGLRETADIIEQEGVKRAKAAMEEADCILLMIDCQDKETVSPLQKKNTTIIYNKIDLINRESSIEKQGDHIIIYLSVRTGKGIELLKQHLKECMGFDSTVEGKFIARRRHLNALEKAKECLLRGQKQLKDKLAGELLAEDLLQAQNALSEITGEFRSDDLLGKIFSEFCIGK